MASRYGILAFYSWSLALVAGIWLARSLVGAGDFPSAGVTAACVGAGLLVFQFGVRAPRVGLISMERVPQIGLLLVVSPPAAAAICAMASLLWPLINRRYSQGSFTVAMLRGVHNGAMTALMMLTAGYLYQVLGGRSPLNGLIASDAVPLVVMAFAIQVVNISLMTLFFKFDGREVKQVVTPSYALSDLIFVPAGILAAVLFNAHAPAIFALFVILMVVFVLSFNGLGQGLGASRLDRGPLAKLFQTRRALHGARSLDELGDRVVAEARTLFRFDEFYLALVDQKRDLLDLRVHERAKERVRGGTRSLRFGLFGWVIERCRPALVSDWRRVPELLRQRTEATDREAGSLLAVPLLEQGAAIGVLSVQHAKSRIYSAADLHLLQRLAEEVSVAVVDARTFEDAEDNRHRLEQRVTERTEELERANREKERLIAALRERSQALERESQEDALTGLGNRRSFMQRLQAEMEVAAAVGQPLSIAIADLDHFKMVNDRLGHRLGDEALRHSAKSMHVLCRETDLLARIGGEEFAILMPGTTSDTAILLCDAMRQRVESFDWRTVHSDLSITISMGLWQWDGKSTVSELLHAADLQLYEAKRGGRNRVA